MPIHESRHPREINQETNVDIEKAKKIRIGQIVNYPADRGEAAGSGRVTFTQPLVYSNASGVEYVWVNVRKPDGSSAVWQSNRLS